MGKNKMYLKFLAMILLSMAAMYAISYLNLAEAGDARWSETRLFMNLMMGASMAVIMLTFMRGMYKDKRLNLAIYAASAVTFALALVLVRSQATVQDLAYMRGMIPHHSIAILTSGQAKIRDQRVRQLADRIAESQRAEIKEMTWLVNDIQENGLAKTKDEALRRAAPSFRDDSQKLGRR